MQIWINPLECKWTLRLMLMEQHYRKSNKMGSFTPWHLCQNQCYQWNEIMMHMTGRHLGSLNHCNIGDIGYKGPKSQLRLLRTIRISYQASIILQRLANGICDGWRALRDLTAFITIHWGQRTQWRTSLAGEKIIILRKRRNQSLTHSLRIK